MDFGDYAYIIFLVLGAIFSAFNKKKKKNRQQPTVEEKPSSNTSVSFEDLIARLNDQVESKSTPTPTQPISSQVTPTVEPRVTSNFSSDKRFEDDNKHVERKEKVNTPRTGVEKIKVHDNPIEQNVFSSEEEENFDLRQAVIYSEILKRPYE